MELFDAIPASLFNILTSKNRDIYAAALISVRNAFKEDIMLDKDVLTNHLISDLQNIILDLDIEADGEYTDENIKDVKSVAKYIVKRLKDTGWLDSEYARGSRLQEFVTLPQYSIMMLDLIYNLTSDEIAEYDAFMYSIYSALVSADNEYRDYRYTALITVYDKIQKFEGTLKGLFSDLKRHYTRMGHLKTINQLLVEHFDSYQKDVIKQIYLPLKTKDSISRFKGPIINILSKWLRSSEIINEVSTQAIIQNRFKSIDDARDDIISKINYITDKLISLQDLLSSIDERNNEYVQSATDKMRYLLRNDQSIKGKLTKIIEQLGKERLDNETTSLDLLNETIVLYHQDVVTEESLYNRKNAERDSGEGELLTLDDVPTIADDFINDTMRDIVESKYSSANIVKFMHEQMDELDELSSKDLNIDSLHSLIMVMYAFIKSCDNDIFYRLNLRKGNIVNNNYSIPDMDFVRKEKN